MPSNDYIIAFDDYGTPYIEHGLLSRMKSAVSSFRSSNEANQGTRENHKYIAKIDVNGKPRYFYSQSEYDAYLKTKNDQAKAQKVLSRPWEHSKSELDAAKESYGRASRVQAEVLKRSDATAEKAGRTAKMEATLKARSESSKPSLKEKITEEFRNKKSERKNTQDKETYEKRKEETSRIEKAQEDLGRAARLTAGTKAETDQLKQRLEIEKRESENINKPIWYRSKHRKEAEAIERQLTDKKEKEQFQDKVESAEKNEKKAAAALSREKLSRASRELGAMLTGSGDQYNARRISKAVSDALQNDGVKEYSGKDKEIKDLYKNIRSKREEYEVAKADNEIAKQLSHEAEVNLRKAKTELHMAKLNNKSSRYIQELQSLYDSAQAEYDTRQKEYTSAQKQVTRYESQYNSLVTQYKDAIELEAVQNRVGVSKTNKKKQ